MPSALRPRNAASSAVPERPASATGSTSTTTSGWRWRRPTGGAGGARTDVDDAAHLTWDELLAPPPGLDAIVERRRAEQDRLAGLSLPATISVVGADSALARA